jgi:hypothetical protein
MIVRTRGADYAAQRGPIAEAIRARQATAAYSPTNPEALAAVGAAITWASEQVAMLPLRVWRGVGLDRAQVTTTWQARLLGGEFCGEGLSVGVEVRHGRRCSVPSALPASSVR